MRVATATCSKYQTKTVPYFDHFFNKFWPNQAYELISDALGQVSFYAQGTWSDVIRAYCSHLLAAGERTFILLLDDYILPAPPDIPAIEKCWNYASEHPEVGCVRLGPCPGPTLDFPDFPLVGRIDPKEPYAFSLQPTIWNAMILRDLLVPGEGPWEVEINGSRRVHNEILLGLRYYALPVANLMRRGELQAPVMHWMQENW